MTELEIDRIVLNEDITDIISFLITHPELKDIPPRALDTMAAMQHQTKPKRKLGA